MLAGETPEDGFTSRDFDEVEDGQSEQNQNYVGEPWIQGSEVQALRHLVGVEELEDVEVEEIEAVAALANEKEGTPREDSRDGMGAAETDNQGRKDWGHEAAVDEEVRGVENEGVEKDSDGGEADC